MCVISREEEIEFGIMRKICQKHTTIMWEIIINLGLMTSNKTDMTSVSFAVQVAVTISKFRRTTADLRIHMAKQKISPLTDALPWNTNYQDPILYVAMWVSGDFVSTMVCHTRILWPGCVLCTVADELKIKVNPSYAVSEINVGADARGNC